MRWTRQRQAMSGDGWAGHKARELTNGTQTNGAKPVEAFGWDGVLRTVKTCRSGTRCWCQVCGGASAQPGSDKPLIRRWRWQDEFVAGESTK